MTRIDFYILPNEEQKERLLFACRLVEKAYKMGHQVYINTDNEETTASMDDVLWQYRPDSFLPHNRIEKETDAAAPIEIGHQHDPEQHHDILVNLAHETPPFFSRFHRVTEIVVQQEKTLEASRKSYAFYRDRGYPMQTHDMRKK